MTDENNDFDFDAQTENNENDEAVDVMSLNEHAMHLHDLLDEIRETAGQISGELEVALPGLEDGEKAQAQQTMHVALMAQQRVTKGDSQIVRGF